MFKDICKLWDLLPLKPMYSFGKLWKLKVSLMGFVYRVVRVLKVLWIFLSETFNFLRKLHKTNTFGLPKKTYHRVMYIATSSGHISLNFNILFKLILRRFEVVFWYLEWECCTFVRLIRNPPILYYGFNGTAFLRRSLGSNEAGNDETETKLIEVWKDFISASRKPFVDWRDNKNRAINQFEGASRDMTQQYMQHKRGPHNHDSTVCPNNKSPGGLNAHLNWRKLPLVHIGVCYQLEKLWRPSPWLLFT